MFQCRFQPSADTPHSRRWLALYCVGSNDGMLKTVPHRLQRCAERHAQRPGASNASPGPLQRGVRRRLQRAHTKMSPGWMENDSNWSESSNTRSSSPPAKRSANDRGASTSVPATAWPSNRCRRYASRPELGSTRRRWLARAKVPAFRLYDLRHTFASLLLAAGAPITYVSAQLGHANPATTLRYYARWVPSRGRRWVDLLDRVTDAVASAAEAVSGAIWNQIWNQTGLNSQIGHSGDSEAPDLLGGPSGTRTPDPLIKSQLLCQLS